MLFGEPSSAAHSRGERLRARLNSRSRPLETARRWRADRNTGQVRPQRLVTAGLASGRCRLPVLVPHLLHFTVRLHIAFGLLFR